LAAFSAAADPTGSDDLDLALGVGFSVVILVSLVSLVWCLRVLEQDQFAAQDLADRCDGDALVDEGDRQVADRATFEKMAVTRPQLDRSRRLGMG
jgi:hypothetical protein